jgi:hypothetical protein
MLILHNSIFHVTWFALWSSSQYLAKIDMGEKQVVSKFNNGKLMSFSDHKKFNKKQHGILRNPGSRDEGVKRLPILLFSGRFIWLCGKHKKVYLPLDSLKLYSIQLFKHSRNPCFTC